MKSVGIIGGLGPETTAEFYLEVIFRCQNLNTKQRPLIVMSSVPLPFEIENELLATGKGEEEYLPFLITEARRLEVTGVDFLVMPCNSLHVFIDELRRSVKIPVLSIIEETVNYLKDQKISRIGLISTLATVNNKLYEQSLKAAKIEVVLPNDLQQAKMDKVIQRLVSGVHLNKDREYVQTVVKSLTDQGVESVALACTDLQILIPHSNDVTIFDTMKIFAETTANNLLSS